MASNDKEPIARDGHELRLQDVRCRLRDHVYLHYLNYSFFIKGAIIAAAGGSIFLLVVVGGYSNAHERESLWLASFSFSLVTLTTWSRGAALANWHANVFDFIFPVAMGITELLLFLVLTPTQALPGVLRNLPDTLWQIWYVLFAVFSVFGALLVWNRRRQARIKEFDDDPELLRVVNRYRSWLLSDQLGALFTGGIAAAEAWDRSLGNHYFENYVTPYLAPYHLNVHIAVGGLLTLIAVLVLTRTNNQYRVLGRL